MTEIREFLDRLRNYDNRVLNLASVRLTEKEAKEAIRYAAEFEMAISLGTVDKQ